MEKIKVLIISGDMDVGGIQNQLMHLLRNIDKEKFQIDFTSTMSNAFYRKEIEGLGARFFSIPQMHIKNPLPYCKAIYQIMREGNYNIVHSHELFHSGIVLAVAKAAGVPCRFVHAHNWNDDDGTGKKRGLTRTIYNYVMQKLICRYSTVQIACSSWAANFLYGKAAKKPSCHLVYNSVDTSIFLRNYDLLVSGEFCEDEWINVLHVGRITPVKNQSFLIQIAAELKRRGLKIRILCAGTGDKEYMNQLLGEIRNRDLNEYIQFIGVRKDIDVLMKKSKAFVLPSKYEGMPLVLIEAQASGLPCVSADTFSREVDFEIGTLVWMDLDDGACVWADAIEQAVQSKRAEKSIVEKAIAYKRFDSKLFAMTLMDLYSEDYRRAIKMKGSYKLPL